VETYQLKNDIISTRSMNAPKHLLPLIVLVTYVYKNAQNSMDFYSSLYPNSLESQYKDVDRRGVTLPNIF